MIEDIDGGRPVSDQFPLSAASKKGDAKNNTSLCALLDLCDYARHLKIAVGGTDQKVVLPTTILTVPGNLPFFVKVSSISIEFSLSSMLSSEMISSDSHSWRSHGGEPEERKIPEAAAWVSIGELRDADGLLGPRELRAMRMCEGFDMRKDY